MTNRLFQLLACAGLAATVGGCSADAYRADADAQVYRILHDRKQTTLGYQPEAIADRTVNPKPAPPAYAKIPQTPIPPPIIPPMEPTRSMFPWGKLGPELVDTSPATQPQERPSTLTQFGVQAANERAAIRLRLGPPAPGPQPFQFDLFQSLQYACQHGRDYSDQMENLYIFTLDVTLQRHLFEPRPFAGGSLLYTGGQKDVAFKSALTATANAGIKQQLPYGGTVMAEALVSFVDAIHGNVSNGESAQLALSGSIPLLRGAGLVNLEPLISSERRLVYQVRAFEDFRRQFAINVARQYFNLINLQQSVQNRRVSYVSLASLTGRTQAIFDAAPGNRALNFLNVQRAYQAQLFAESSLIDSQVNYQAAVDNFKILIGMPVANELEIVPVELDLFPPDVDGDDVQALAIKYRLDLRTAEDQIDDARRNVEVAKSGLLPQLDLVFNSQVGNRPNTLASRLDERSTTYSAGINVDLPVDRLAERNIYRRSLIDLEHTQRNFSGVRDQILADVRGSVRQIKSAQLSLDIQRRNIVLAQSRLEYSNELLKIGTGDSRDVVDAETSLLSAQDTYNSALSSLQIAILQYLRNTGTLRLDPAAGELGYAMDRAAVRENAARREQRTSESR